MGKLLLRVLAIIMLVVSIGTAVPTAPAAATNAPIEQNVSVDQGGNPDPNTTIIDLLRRAISLMETQQRTLEQVLARLNAQPSAPAQQGGTQPPAVSGGTNNPPQQGGSFGSVAWRTPYTAHTSQPDPIRAQKMHIINGPNDGVSNVWEGVQLDLSKLENLGQNEIYLAHGDVNGTGSCAIKIWYKGKPQQGQLSAATWQMYRIRSDSMPALDDAAAVEQLIAERLSSPCPVVNKY